MRVVASSVCRDLKLLSIFLDIVLECNLEDSDHPGPSMMDIEIFCPERKTSEALILKKVSRLVWKHDDGVKLYVLVKPRF